MKNTFVLLQLLTDKIYIKIFSKPIGNSMRTFISNLGILSLGTLGGILLLSTVNILAGRLLGPIEYGKYSIVISLGQLFIIPMIFGSNTASVRYISFFKKKTKKLQVFQNTFFLSFILTSFSLVIFYIFRHQFSSFFKVDQQIYSFILIYSSIFSIKCIAESVLKGYRQFKFLSILEIVSSSTVFFIFFTYIYLFKNNSFEILLVPNICGLLIYLIFFLRNNSFRFKFFKLNTKVLKTILNYGKFATLGGISGIAINNIDKFILNKYTSFAEVGTYSMYLSSSGLVGGIILQIFIQVFFPTVSSIKNKQQIYIKLIKLLSIAFVPVTFINFCFTSGVLFLVGNQYAYNPIYALLFSILGTFSVFSNILWWLINSYGKSGIKFTSIIGLFIGSINILLILLFINKLGFIGIVYSLIIINILMIVFAMSKLSLNKK